MNEKKKKEEEKMRLPALLCLLCAAAGPAAAADRSCTDLRQFYTGKGFTLAGVPQSEISGKSKKKRKKKHLIEFITLFKSHSATLLSPFKMF